MKINLKVWWDSFKDQIVQDVPQGLDYCQFECRRARCTLEATGSCDLLAQYRPLLIPDAIPVLIMPAPAFSSPIAAPAMTSPAAVCASQADSAAACTCATPAQVA